MLSHQSLSGGDEGIQPSSFCFSSLISRGHIVL